ncbi:nucleoside hydrolase [Allorhodopirellula heiligendammensis]|uniref:Pyrimidine-specific ribonucleoside hydrolase RihB n=1 Tax=Allorhodopirellula heiligendammensis TaxID=2714739 RepID=A0A5C6BTJ2_9BACT|nr:nucleoside hydrolase [Allorhodopirellula heiligendammensis]TWU15162.1 Pyrimidine-specific ribonucleoside hydrolase RihB [Allorhodopirellula heiligendammensis]
MSRKIILDCDPGIDGAVAITMALFDPRLNVLAVTSTAGTVDAEQANTNTAAIIAKLDPARYPRIGSAVPPLDAPVLDDLHLNGPDGLAGCHFPTATRQNDHPSDKVMADLIRRYPGEVTIVCLGPLSNLARLLRRDPMLIPLIDKVIVSGGAVAHSGNASAVAEMNFFFDPTSAREVFASPTTKSLVPLDVTDSITFGLDLIENLPSEATRAGWLLHKILTYKFRVGHQKLGREVMPLQDAVTMISLVEPELFQWEEMAGDVEVSGTLTRGMTLFDRRMRPEWKTNMEVARRASASDVRDAIIRGLRYAGQQT